jgi:hypothetical protein
LLDRSLAGVPRSPSRVDQRLASLHRRSPQTASMRIEKPPTWGLPSVSYTACRKFDSCRGIALLVRPSPKGRLSRLLRAC